MKIETNFFYISIDREGFLIELGSIDKPTAILSFGLCLKWWKDLLELLEDPKNAL